jgi:hypothetical protein
MPRRRERPKEPLLLWWMPLLALLAPLLFAAWKAAAADSGAAEAFALALAWPGGALYLGTLAVLWAGWKIELE